jgi:16S rRNA (guanine527-N7)-methyltransferase
MSSRIGDIVGSEAAAMGLVLSGSQIAAFETYAAELIKWNAKVNLTAITKDAEIAIKHFVDSLALVPLLEGADRLLDIGSGAGLPVLPLKIVRPEVAMTSVDAVAKKIHFQRHVIRLLNLPQIEAIHSRIEALHATHQKAFTVITSRAFTRLDRFAQLAAPLLADDGRLVAMKGGGTDDEISGSDCSLTELGFEISSVQRYSLPHNMGERILTVLKRCKAA